MKVTVFTTALFAAAASAASTTSQCPGINILEACLQTTQAYLTECGTSNTNYQCLCDKWTAIMTCFNNCPTDSRASSFGNNKTLYCMNASAFATTTSVAKPTGTQSSSTAQTTSADSDSAAAASASTSSGPKPSTTPGAAANLAVSAGGILAAVAGVVAAVL